MCGPDLTAIVFKNIADNKYIGFSSTSSCSETLQANCLNQLILMSDCHLYGIRCCCLHTTSCNAAILIPAEIIRYTVMMFPSGMTASYSFRTTSSWMEVRNEQP
jgi:hypothetical protein